MAEYTRGIDAQISEELRLRGRVAPDAIPGFTDEQGAEFLRRYLEVHRDEVPLRIEEGDLVFDVPPPSEAAALADLPSAEVGMPGPSGSGFERGGVHSAGGLSPVDEVLAQTGGKTLLDTPTIGGRVNKALWLLPFAFGIVGGLIAWALARGESERTARQMLVAGAVLSVLWACVGIATGPLVGGLMDDSRVMMGGATWPVSQSGHPTFYYFGTAT